jgi:hypothetical protein
VCVCCCCSLPRRRSSSMKDFNIYISSLNGYSSTSPFSLSLFSRRRRSFVRLFVLSSSLVWPRRSTGMGRKKSISIHTHTHTMVVVEWSVARRRRKVAMCSPTHGQIDKKNKSCEQWARKENNKRKESLGHRRGAHTR